MNIDFIFRLSEYSILFIIIIETTEIVMLLYVYKRFWEMHPSTFIIVR